MSSIWILIPGIFKYLDIYILIWVLQECRIVFEVINFGGTQYVVFEVFKHYHLNRELSERRIILIQTSGLD